MFSLGGVIKYIIKVEATELCYREHFSFFFITHSYAISVKYFIIRGFLVEEIKWI